MKLTLKVFFLFSFVLSAFASVRPPHAGILDQQKTKEGMVYTEIKKMGDYLLIYPLKLSGKKWTPIPLSEISNGKITLTHPKIKKRTVLDLVSEKEIFSVPVLYSKDPTLMVTLYYTYRKQVLSFNYVLNSYEEQK